MQTLISQADIEHHVSELGQRISQEYVDRELTLLGILTGSIVFLADLTRQIEIPHQIGLIQASSYRGRVTSPGELRVNLDLIPDVVDRDVILVDDIFDTGHTLQRLLQVVSEQFSPNSVRSAVLLRKEGRCEVAVQPDFHCFEIPDVFVVGYGLDYADEHRHLPYIAALDAAEL